MKKTLVTEAGQKNIQHVRHVWEMWYREFICLGDIKEALTSEISGTKTG